MIKNKITLKNEKVIYIRTPRYGDEYELLRFINELSSEKTYILAQGKKYTLKEERGYLNKCLIAIKKNNSAQIFAFHENKIIANTSIVKKESEAESHIGIFGIAISKEFRDLGLGKIIMNEVHNLAIKKIEGLKIFELAVFGNNQRGIHLYEKFGYKVFGRLPKGILYKRKYIEHIMMYKNVK